MRSFVGIAFGALLLASSSPAQNIDTSAPAADATTAAAATAASSAAASDIPDIPPSDPSAGAGSATTPEFVPMTMSERSRRYIIGAFGPAAILRAVAAGGIAQAQNTPKEWGGGAEAYGERIGNVLAKHVIREALEFGGSAALHEDNRYIRSTETGFLKRSKHVVASVFVARNDAGQEHFAYSRFGSVIGSSFISRLWQPRSTNSSGDAAVSFGLTMVSDMGWNFFREFGPKRFRKH